MLRIVAESKKRHMLALFLCLFAAACSARQDHACQATGELRQIALEHVYDGDTLRLRGGEKLRLIGVNTPELGRNGRAPEPQAEEARAALRSLVAGGLVWLQDGEDRRDRYGRKLAYAFDREGRSLSGALLQQGLGFQVLVAPNFRYVDCLAALEEQARQGRLGVWGMPQYTPLGVTDLRPSQGGFLRVQE